jgi:hypothetical protein
MLVSLEYEGAKNMGDVLMHNEYYIWIKEWIIK